MQGDIFNRLEKKNVYLNKAIWVLCMNKEGLDSNFGTLEQNASRNGRSRLSWTNLLGVLEYKQNISSNRIFRNGDGKVSGTFSRMLLMVHL